MAKFPLLKKIFDWFAELSAFKKIIFISFVIVFGWFTYVKINAQKNNKVQYQTSITERGTLVVSIAGSGTVSTANSSSINTQVTGVVSQLYVKDGDEVKAGDKIVEIDLDLSGQQKASQALASYQSAKNAVDSAKVSMYTLQSDMFTQWKKQYETATNSTYQNADGTPNNINRALPDYHILDDNWLASEAKYKNQQNVVNQAQTSLNSAWLSYQQSSSTVYAPISGKVSGLSVQTGSVISSSSSTGNQTTAGSTKIASIKTRAMPTVSINLSEIDIPKVKIGDNATVILDALTDKTFTGKVISIDTVGTVSSGVTTYPVIIQLDLESNSILPNMAATANIITATKDNVLLVPASSIQSQNEEIFVRVMKNNKPKEVAVETGLSSDTQTEITSGLSEDDIVVTNIIQSNTASQRQTTSPFGGSSGGSFRQSGVMRINR